MYFTLLRNPLLTSLLPRLQEFVDLLALGMTLPGPTSSEFCIAGELL